MASTESALFARYCEGIQAKVNSILSRALTLALRLLGHDVYAQFSFDRVDLRPDSELETFRVLKQSRILEQLSIGMITDDDASIELTGRLPADGAQILQGTFFKTGSSAPSDPNLAAAQGDNNTGAQGQTLSPDGPTNVRGSKPQSNSGAPPALKQVK